MRKKIVFLLLVSIILLGIFSGLSVFFNDQSEKHGRPDGLFSGKDQKKVVFKVLSKDMYPLSDSLFTTISSDLCVLTRVMSGDGVFEYSSDLEMVSSDRFLSGDESGSLPEIAIVIDDFGYSSSMAEDLASLDIPQTWTIIPYLDGTDRAIEIASEKDIPYLIHMPMQAFIDEVGGPYIIGVDMESHVVREEIKKVTDTYPGAVGMNNHRGSKATSNKKIMNAVMEELSMTDLFFLDSRTSSSSVAYETALDRNIPAFYNNIFLDNSSDIREISSVFEKIVRMAERNGQVIAICHVRPVTVEFLADLCTKRVEGVEFVTVPELLKAREGK